MKVHILLKSDEHTNGRIVGVFTDRTKAEAHFYLDVGELAQTIGDDEYESSCTLGDECWSYMPDDTEDHENVSLMLFRNVEVIE